jgi:hypothetical protein
VISSLTSARGGLPCASAEREDGDGARKTYWCDEPRGRGAVLASPEPAAPACLVHAPSLVSFSVIRAPQWQ